MFLILCLIGGTTYAVQKIGLTNSLPLWSAGMRFIIAGILMAVLTFCKEGFIPNKKTITTGISYGLLYFAIPFGLVYWLGQFLNSSLLSVLSSSVSVFAVIFNALFHNERTTKAQLYGIFLSMLGVCIVFLDSIFCSYNAGETLYLLVGIFAYCCAAYATAFLKHKINHIQQNHFNTIALLTGGIILALASLLLEDGIRTFSSYSLWALLYLSIAGSVLSTKITTYLISQWNVAKVTAYRFISPVISIAVGFFLWQESFNTHEIIGCIFIIAGTFAINRQ